MQHFVEPHGARTSLMSRGGAAAALVLAATLLCLAPAPAAAQSQETPELRNANIALDYYEPRNPDFLPLYERLQRRRVLEELGQFLAPLNWPKKLRLIMKQCPSSSRTPTAPELFYSSLEYSLNVCYQWFRFLRDLQPPATLATQQEVVVGGLVGVMLHEAGRAAFDMLKVPRLGAESDAADQIANYVALQFGPEVAQTIIKGTYFVWDTYDYYIHGRDLQYDFSHKASVARQRAYNTLCIGYGGAAATFQPLIDQGLLPEGRAGNCADEYRQVKRAFDKTILPHVDRELMKKVRSMQWLRPEDLR
jgi:Putative metallopeptidase